RSGRWRWTSTSAPMWTPSRVGRPACRRRLADSRRAAPRAAGEIYARGYTFPGCESLDGEDLDGPRRAGRPGRAGDDDAGRGRPRRPEIRARIVAFPDRPRLEVGAFVERDRASAATVHRRADDEIEISVA